MKALPARVILGIHDIDINSKENLVRVDAGKHQVMHTNEYYIFVNVTIFSAHMAGGKPKVEDALKGLKTAIGDWTIPF